MPPIRIYLDSSDFSNLSQLPSPSPAHEEVLSYLIKKREEGAISIYYSDAHVLEAAPTTVAAIPDAMQRFRIIKTLCGKNSLINSSDLFESEQQGRSLKSVGRVFRSDGAWMPNVGAVPELLPDIEQVIADEITKKFPGRAERRQFFRNGKITAKAYAEMGARHTDDAYGDLSRLPLSGNAIRTVKRYFSGLTSRTDALNALNDSLNDLEVFGRWYANDWTAASDFSRGLRQAGEEFRKKLLEARKDFELLLTNESSDEDAKKVLSSSMQAFHEVVAVGQDRIVKDAHERALAVGTDRSAMKAAPGAACSMKLAMYVARRSVHGKSPRVPSHSDFPDTYHAIYLPYVDIFRADVFMASVIRECKFPFPTVIADSLLRLPARIEQMINSASTETWLSSV